MEMPNNRPWPKLLITAVLATGWWALLHYGVHLGDVNTPPLGTFLNPYEGFYRSTQTNYWKSLKGATAVRAPVKVVYDERLVPHIYATSAADLYYVQGYVQAQHRLFQFDVTARSAEGRLSEVLGEQTLELDITRRRIGGAQLADQIDSLWRLDARAYEAVSRYADGVNAYIATLQPHDYPIEYKLLDFAPEPWSPRKTALVALSMAYTLNYKNEDVLATNTRALLGEQTYNVLFPERNPLTPPVIPAGTGYRSEDTLLIRQSESLDFSARSDTRQKLLPEVRAVGGEAAPSGIGSNNWAVAGSRTATGRPLLANDPHLGLSLPSIWFECELHAGGLHVHGVSLPGAPGIIIGFNEQAAWGVTNVGMDVLDWHELKYTDADRTVYLDRNNQPRVVQQRVDRIKVRGQADVLDTVQLTSYGPIVYPAGHEDSHAGYAMEWLTLEKPSAETINAFLRLNQAHEVDDFREASKVFEWPAQNIVFANHGGDIALRVSGLRPRKLPQQGRFVIAHGSPQAVGFLGADANPMAINPAQGFVASTNQISTAADYPYYYTGTFDAYRSRRINEQLASIESASMTDMAALQLDDYSVLAADLAPVLLDKVDRSELSLEARGLLEVLEAWDYRYRADAVAPVILERWLREVDSLTWDEITTRAEVVMTPNTWVLVDLLKDDPLSPWFDHQSTPAREHAGDLITLAFHNIAEPLAEAVAEEQLDWAHENNPSVMHLAKIPAFSREHLRIGGTSSALNAQRGNIGPSWRMVVSLEEPVRAQVVYPGGQSGRPGHPHYADMLDAWAAGEYYQVRLELSHDALAERPGAVHLTAKP